MLRRRPVLDLADYAGTVEPAEAEELVPCPLCGGDRVQPLFAPRQPGEWEYRVVRCVACGMLFRNPGIRPERVGDFYRDGYARFLTGRYAERRQDDYRVTLDALDGLFAEGAGRRLLDYGCGVGLFLVGAQ